MTTNPMRSLIAGFRSVRKRRRFAFTLIEMMIVMAIVIGMVAMTVGVSVTLHLKSEVRQIEQALKLLDMALMEYELAAERQLTWGPNPPAAGSTPGVFYDISSNPAVSKVAAFNMKQVLRRLSEVPESKAIMSKINPRFLLLEDDPDEPGQKRYVMRDPWDQTIIPVHPGRLPNPTLFPDDAGATLLNCGLDADGTIRTSSSTALDVNEVRMGICQNRRMLFVCRGPDGDVGDLQLNKQIADAGFNQAKFNATKDNLYSYPPILTRCP